jgi:hypothetical protein
MAKYFSYFPSTVYKLSDDSQNFDIVTNIMSRFNMDEKLKENTAIYYKYDVADDETPEIIAYKIYGSVEKHWVVLMMNNIVDPQYDWPLSFRSLTEYVDKKYSANNYADTANTSVRGLIWSKQNIHSYYRIETTEYSGNTFSQTLQIDSSTYANTVANTSYITLQDGNEIKKSTLKQTKTYYEIEEEKNENKRAIKLLKPEFVFGLEEELRSVLR